MFFQHEFVNRSALCAALMLPLITVLEAPPSKSRTPVDDDTEEELDDITPDSENKVCVATLKVIIKRFCLYHLEKEFQKNIVS